MNITIPIIAYVRVSSRANTEPVRPTWHFCPELIDAFFAALHRPQDTFEEASEPAWCDAEQNDLFCADVQREIGRHEDDLWEGGAEPENDPMDGFCRHCAEDRRRGRSPTQSARRWRSRPV